MHTHTSETRIFAAVLAVLLALAVAGCCILAKQRDTAQREAAQNHARIVEMKGELHDLNIVLTNDQARLDEDGR